ncbi:MAG TPA: hypothetical protein VGF24_17120 [Vicinamibacterales bacterium]
MRRRSCIDSNNLVEKVETWLDNPFSRRRRSRGDILASLGRK